MDPRRKKKETRPESGLVSKCKKNKEQNKKIRIIRTGSEGGSRKVLKVPEMRNSAGEKYMPYCNYGWHQGILLGDPSVCIERRCRHYRTMYSEKPDFDEL